MPAMRHIKRTARNKALAAGCDTRAARHAARRARYWRRRYHLSPGQAIAYGVRDGQVHQQRRALTETLAALDNTEPDPVRLTKGKGLA